jgi:hypothetical protein
MWECALNPASKSVLPDGSCFPPMHQISRRTKRDSSEEFLKSEFPPVRYLRKFSFGGSLNLFVTPKGGRYWRYCYRYGGKRKTLSLGIYPEVPVDRARSRHLEARQLLAAGVDPSLSEKSYGVRFDCGVAELVDNRYLARRRPTITPRSCDTINPAT